MCYRSGSLINNIKICLKFNTERLLRLNKDGSGYFQVALLKNGIEKRFKVHQLVAMCFLNHKPCGMNLVVNHINFNRNDNRIDNLEIVTARENANLKHIKSSSKYLGVT